MLSNYEINRTIDARFRGQAYTPVVTLYAALILATKGQWAPSTAYAVGDTIVTGSPSNNRLYKCTTAGTSGAAAPAWGTVDGGTTADNTVAWTEQTVALKAGTFNEVTGAGYARVAVTASLANFAGTQGAGTTAASSGTSGATSNNNTITFPAPTADWGVCAGLAWLDGGAGGNLIDVGIFTNPKTVNNGDPAPELAVGAYTFTD